MKVINLYGGPGTGKSTTAAGLFYLMKREGFKVELITEYAKELVYSDADKILSDQIHVCAEQHHRLHRLKKTGVEYVIMDSPILLSVYYAKYGSLPRYITKTLAYSLYPLYDNFDVFIKRTKPFVKLGRKGNEQEAKDADEGIRELLLKFDYEIEDSPIICQKILQELLNDNNKQKTAKDYS